MEPTCLNETDLLIIEELTMLAEWPRTPETSAQMSVLHSILVAVGIDREWINKTCNLPVYA